MLDGKLVRSLEKMCGSFKLEIIPKTEHKYFYAHLLELKQKKKSETYVIIARELSSAIRVFIH